MRDLVEYIARALVDDPAQAERIQVLRAMMDEWFARYVDPRRDGLTQDGTKWGQTRRLG